MRRLAVLPWLARMSSADVVVTLPADLVDLVESGASILVGTRDARLRPECVRAVGASVARDRRSIVVLLNQGTSARTIANLEAGSPFAVTFSRPIDHRTYQVKGSVRAIRPSTPAEQEAAQRYRIAFTEALYVVGVGRSLTRRMRVNPCVAVEVEVAELYQQTPGPDAGKRMGAA